MTAPEQSLAVGGQAVLEGVMMRGASCLAVAVRRPDGRLVVREGPLGRGWTRRAFARWPGVRGVAALVDAFTTGFGALRFSAEQQMTAAEREADADSGGSRWAVALSVALALGLFVALPQFLAAGLGALSGHPLEPRAVAFHVVTGAFKLAVLVGYLALVGRLPEMQRLFAYHGAEHKTIHAHERGHALTVEAVRAMPKAHPRCGTTLLVTVVLVSIVLGSILVPLFLGDARGWAAHAGTLAIRIAILPLVASVAYELQRVGARFVDHPLLGALSWPGLLVQRLTTREPDAAMIEVAIAALETTRFHDAGHGGAPLLHDSLTDFPSLEAFRARVPAQA